MDHDRIYCEELHCELSRVICIKRQEMAAQSWSSHQECVDCEQGTTIRGGNGMAEKKTPLTCRIDGCDKPVLARWMCQPHYDQWRARGKKPEELPEGLGERKLPIGAKKAARRCAKAKPTNGHALKAGPKAPASITQFVEGLMATVRRELIAELRGEINQAFDRMGRA